MIAFLKTGRGPHCQMTTDPGIGFAWVSLVPVRRLVSIAVPILVCPDGTNHFSGCPLISFLPACGLRDRPCDPPHRFLPACHLSCRPNPGSLCCRRWGHWSSPKHRDYCDPLLRLPTQSGWQKYCPENRRWAIQRTPAHVLAWGRNRQRQARQRSGRDLYSTKRWPPHAASRLDVVASNVSNQQNWSLPEAINWRTDKTPTGTSLEPTMLRRFAGRTVPIQTGAAPPTPDTSPFVPAARFCVWTALHRFRNHVAYPLTTAPAFSRTGVLSRPNPRHLHQRFHRSGCNRER